MMQSDDLVFTDNLEILEDSKFAPRMMIKLLRRPVTYSSPGSFRNLRSLVRRYTLSGAAQPMSPEGLLCSKDLDNILGCCSDSLTQISMTKPGASRPRDRYSALMAMSILKLATITTRIFAFELSEKSSLKSMLPARRHRVSETNWLTFRQG